MLHIQNIRKLEGKYIGEGWHIKNINGHPTLSLYMFELERSSPMSTIIGRCTISINRKAQMTLNPKTNLRERTYHFTFNGNFTNVCGTADWLADTDNFVSQLTYIIQKNYIQC